MANTPDVTIDLGLDASEVKSSALDAQIAIEDALKALSDKPSTAAMDKIVLSLRSAYNEINKLYDTMYAQEKAPDFTPEFAQNLDAIIQHGNAVKSLENELISKQQTLKQLELERAVVISKTGKEYGVYERARNSLEGLVENYSKFAQLEQYIREHEQAVKNLQVAYNQTRDPELLRQLNQIRPVLKALKKEYDALEPSMSAINARAEDVAEAMQDVYTSTTRRYKSDDQKRLNHYRTNIDKLTESIKKEGIAYADAVRKRREYEAAGTDKIKVEDDPTYKANVEALDKIINKTTIDVKRLNEAINKQDHKNAFMPQISSVVDFANNIKQLPQMLESSLDQMARMLPPWAQLIYSAVKAVVKAVINEIIITAKQIATTIKNYIVKALNVATTAAKNFAKALLTAASNVVLSPFKKMAESIKKIGDNAQKSTPTLKQIGRAFLQYGIGARSLYRLINKLRTALFQGFENLALSFEPFNAAMSQISTSLEYLKNSFAAAFAPIIQAVAPALSLLINKVAEAVQWIGQLIALLTGQQFVMAQPVYKDYAANTSAGAAAAKQAAKNEKDRAKALKKTAKEMRTIAGFDDVEILKAPDDSNSGSGAGTGSGGGAGGAGYSFVPGKINEGLQAFADMLKKAWKTADAYDLGRLVSNKLKNLLETYNKNIEKIQGFTRKIAKIVASFLAGILSVNDTFVELGKAIGNTINTIFTTIDAFLDTFAHYDGFRNLGKDIYLTIINALNTINWETIYAVFSKLGTGIAQTLNETLTKPDLWSAIFEAASNLVRASVIRLQAFASELNWAEIGAAMAHGIVDGIETFPFDEAAQAFATFVNGIFSFIGSFAEAMGDSWFELGQNIGNAIMSFFDSVLTEENGASLGKFLQGIFDTLRGLIETINFEQVSDDIVGFLKGFFENFNWEENSTTLLTFLNGLLGAFLNLVTEKIPWENIVSNIWNYIENSPEVQKFIDTIWDTIITIAKAKLTLKWSTILSVGTSVIYGILEGMLLPLANGMNWLQTHVVDPIIDWFFKLFDINSPAKTIIPVGEGIIEGLWQGITDLVDKAGTWLSKNVFSPIHSGLETAFGVTGKIAGKIKDIGESVINGLKSGADDEKSQLDTTVTTINTDMQNTLATGDWQKIGSTVITEMKGGMDSIKDDIIFLAKSIQETIYRFLEAGDWGKIGSDVITKLKDGMYSIKSSATGIAEEIQRGIYSALNSGDWDNIGDNIITGIWNGLRNGWNWLYNKVWNLAVDLYNAACRALGIHSPSKVFADKIGEMIPAGISVGVENNENTATKSVEDMANNLVNTAKNIKMPPIAMGEVIPNSIGDTTQQTQVTLQSLLDLLQSLQDNMITQEDLNEAVATAISNFPVNFYVGDEQIARHANAGNKQLERRFGTA